MLIEQSAVVTDDQRHTPGDPHDGEHRHGILQRVLSQHSTFTVSGRLYDGALPDGALSIIDASGHSWWSMRAPW